MNMVVHATLVYSSASETTKWVKYIFNLLKYIKYNLNLILVGGLYKLLGGP